MSPQALLEEILDAHGGLGRWNGFSTLSATIVTGGEFWKMKGIDQDQAPRRIRVSLDQEWASLTPYGNPDWSSVFTPERIAIEDRSGTIIAERFDPRDSFAGHSMTSPWDPLQRAYFNGYALWTYLNAPFLLAQPDVSLERIPDLEAGGELLRGLRAAFPDRIASHSRVQDFYAGPDGLLWRHDYHVDVAGGFAGAHLLSDYVEVDGIKLARKRRAYQRNDDLSPRLEPLMVSIDLGEFAFS